MTLGGIRVVAHVGANWSVPKKPRERAEKLIRAVHSAGAHGVIIEYFEADKVYHQEKMIKSTKQHEMPPEWIYDLRQLALELGLDFIGSPRHPDHVEFFDKIGVSTFHIEMGDITYVPLVEAISGVAGATLANTGLATLAEVGAAREILLDGLEPAEVDLVLLHSAGGFPTGHQDAYLKRMLDLGSEFFPTFVGLESYHNDLLLDYMAMAYEPATIVRKLDLDDKKGVESAYSITPNQLGNLVKMAALAPSIVTPQYFHVEGFTETDWDFRQRHLRCPKNDFLLPPEQ